MTVPAQVVPDPQLDLFEAVRQRNAVLDLIANDPTCTGSTRAIAQAIAANFNPGDEVSANLLRPFLPPWVKTFSIGPVFGALVTRGALVRERDEPSTKRNTHGKPIAVYTVVREVVEP